MPNPRRYADAAQRQAAYRARVAARTLDQSGPDLVSPAPATRPGHPRWQALLRHSLRLLHTVRAEMEHYYDERSEGAMQGQGKQVVTAKVFARLASDA